MRCCACASRVRGCGLQCGPFDAADAADHGVHLDEHAPARRRAVARTLARDERLPARPGVYELRVSDPDPEAFLALRGPGVHKRTTMPFRGVKVWLVRFRPGMYELFSLQDVYGVILRYPKQWKFAVRD